MSKKEINIKITIGPSVIITIILVIMMIGAIVGDCLKYQQENKKGECRTGVQRSQVK